MIRSERRQKPNAHRSNRARMIPEPRYEAEVITREEEQ